jgi:hypothetical protein
MSFLIGGVFGGVLRGSVGIIKYITSYKDVKINPYYFSGTVIISGIVGYVSALIVQDISGVFLELEVLPLSFAIVAGYAGGDFLENLVKIALKDADLSNLGEKIKKIVVEKMNKK